MAPKKKSNKQPCNAFYFYMVELQKKSGGKISLAEAAKKAEVAWPQMSDAQKAPYVAFAKKEKERLRETGDRYTSDGRSLTLLEKEERLKRNKENEMKMSIRDTVQTAVANKTIKDMDFFLIDINLFCTATNNYYVLAELAISKFSLAKGVYDTYHTCINPEEIPVGYSGAAMLNSNETHQLPIPPDALGVSRMDFILNKILQFLLNDGDSLPCLYTLPNNMNHVEGSLIQLCDDVGLDAEFKVYDLAELAMNLLNNCTPDKFDNNTLAMMAFEKDAYEYNVGLGCEYHETTEVFSKCSLSKVKRWAYTINDYVCRHLGIEIIPGYHLPEKVELKESEESEFTTKKGRKGHGSRSDSRASSVITLPRNCQYSAASTPAPSLASSPPRLARQTYYDDQSSSYLRSPSPTESMISSVSKITITSEATARQFPLADFGDENKPSNMGVNEVRRPVTTAQVAKGTAASLLGLSTTDVSSDESNWPRIGEGSSRPRRTAGRGRGIAAKFSNPWK